jgi:hypothetical protein
MKKIVILFAVFISIMSCKVQLSPKPSIGVAGEKPQLEESKIILPLSIDLKKLEDIFNKSVTKGKIVTVKDPGCKRTEYAIDIFRNRPFTLNAIEDKLIVTTNLDLIGKAKHCAGVHDDCGCRTGWCKTKVNIDFNLNIEVDLDLNSQYEVIGNVKLNGQITDGEVLAVKCGSLTFNLPIKDVMGDINDQLKPLEKSINKQINEELKKFELKKEITKAWNDSHQNIPIEQFFLKVIPQNMYFKNFTSTANTVELQAGVGLLLNLTTIQDNIPIGPLPKLTVLDIDESGFIIDLPIDGEFSLISEELNAIYANKKYSYGNSWVKINEITVYGGKIAEDVPVIAFDLDINGKIGWFKKVEGHIFFTAKPELDTEKNIVSLDDFKLEVNSQNEILNKSVQYLVNNFYYEDISKAAIYNFDNDLKNIETQLKNELSNIEIGNYTIKLDLEKVSVDGIYITNDLIGIESFAKGRISKIPVKKE